MTKVLYYIFLFSALIFFVAATEVSFMYSRAFYLGGDHRTAITIWLSITYWCWLFIILFLWLRKELAVIPLVISTLATLNYSFGVFIYNSWSYSFDFTNFCNFLAAYVAVIMVISGYLYYLFLFHENRFKIRQWLKERFYWR